MKTMAIRRAIAAAAVAVLAQRRSQIERDTRAFELALQLVRALGGGVRDTSTFSLR